MKYNPDVFEWCSCLDNFTRYVKCKHLFAIEFAIRMGTLQDIYRLPAEAKRYPAVKTPGPANNKDWRNEDYDF